MLESMRRNSRSVIIYVLFGVIIAAFILSFGPGSRGVGAGPSGSTYAARVAGSTISEADFHFAYIALTRGQISGEMARARQLKENLMNKLIERELFAQEAERLGFEVSAKEAEDMVADGRMMMIGIPRRVDDYVFKNGKFDYERFKMVSQNQLGVSVKRFIDIERRELLADKVRELFKVGIKVSADEVKQDFEQKGLQVNLEFVRFSPRRFEDESEIAPAELDAYAKAHDADLRKLFEERAFLYKKTDKQARLRHIAITVAKDAPAGAGDAARAKLEQAAAKVRAGAALADFAKTLSSDEHARARGGFIGWRKKGFTSLGAALDEKVFAAGTKKGDLIGPEKTERGYELVQVEDFREGDIPFEAAVHELADEAIHTERAKAKAKAEAQALLDKVKKGAKLEDLVPKEAPAETQEEKIQRAMAHRFNEPPKLEETKLFSRRGDLVQEIGVSKELARRAFELKPGELAGPIETGGGYVVVRLKERKEPDLADFQKRKDEIIRDYARTKWTEVLDDWAHQRCVEARDDGRIRVNDEVLAYEGVAPEKAHANKYEPCAPNKLF
jgi:peptidyl-prolyl cis-trans isomerase D